MESSDRNTLNPATQYGELSDQSLYQMFTEKGWKNLTSLKRLDVLQEIECRMAGKQGRRACQVVEKELPPNVYGYFDGNGIVINAKLLRSSRSKFGDPMAHKAIEALDTILHEGRHAYQRTAVTGLTTRNVSVKTRQVWLINLLSYSQMEGDMADFPMYSFQPIERDAREYAARELAGIYRTIVKATGARDKFFEKGLEHKRREKVSEYAFAKALAAKEYIDARFEKICSRILTVLESDGFGMIPCIGEAVSFKECIAICEIAKDSIDEALDAQIADLCAIADGSKTLDSFMDGLDHVLFLETIDKRPDNQGLDSIDAVAARIRERTGLGAKLMDATKTRPDGRIGS